MKLSEVQKLLEARVLGGEEFLDRQIETCCGSDMMSDVLAFVKNQAVLLTGLVNPQVIRTAEMMDMHCIVFVRGKNPSEDMLQLAKECEIVVMSTKMRMFEACGKLYTHGLYNNGEAEV